MEDSDSPLIVMTYASAPIEKSAPPKPKIKRGRGKKDPNNIMYPVFKEASKFTEEDPFWRDVFDRMGYGLFQKGFSMADSRTFSHKKTKNKSETIEVPEDPEECLEKIKSFMKSKGIFSDRDCKLEKIQEERRNSERSPPKDLSWKSITPRSTQKMYVSRHLDFLRERYNLSETEYSHLEDLVSNWLKSSNFNSNYIIMDHEKILEIEPLCFDKETRKFTMNPTLNSTKIKKITTKIAEPKSPLKSPLNVWKKNASGIIKKLNIGNVGNVAEI